MPRIQSSSTASKIPVWKGQERDKSGRFVKKGTSLSDSNQDQLHRDDQQVSTSESTPLVLEGLCLFIIPRSMTYKESTIEKDYKRAHIAESGKKICRAEDAEMTKVTRDMRN